MPDIQTRINDALGAQNMHEDQGGAKESQDRRVQSPGWVEPMASLSAQHPPVLGITKHRDSEAQKSEKKMWRKFFWGAEWREEVTQA